MVEAAVSTVPETVRLMDGDKVALEVTNLTDKWSEGYLSQYNVPISSEYKGSTADRFNVEALNKDGKKLNAEISRLTSVMVQISISDEQYHITIGFKYE